MRRFTRSRVNAKACVRLVLGLLAVTTILAGWASAPSDNAALSPSRVGDIHLTARTGDQPYEASFPFDASTASFPPGITTLWARQRVEDLMDLWRSSDEDARANVQAIIIAHAIRYRLVTRFTSLVAVEEVVANVGGESRTIAVPTELPAGMQLGAPATATADAFLQMLGVTLLLIEILMAILLHILQRRMARKAEAAS